jgi:hypothetical protein
MIEARQVWGVIQGHVPKKEWVPSEEVYALVELYGGLDDEDRQPHIPGSIIPKWKILVGNVLEDRVRQGRVRSRKHSNRV